MRDPQPLSSYLDGLDVLPRASAWPPSNLGRGSVPYWMQSRPSVQQLAEHLLADGEFQALRLGSWLGTPDGEFFARAVELALPLLYREDVKLLIDALQYAAKLQAQQGSQRAAGQFALGACGLFVLAVLITAQSQSAPN